LAIIQCHIYGIPAQTFLKTAQNAPFGGIRHKSGLKMNANGRVWEAKIGSDVVQHGPDEKEGLFLGRMDEISRRLWI